MLGRHYAAYVYPHGAVSFGTGEASRGATREVGGLSGSDSALSKLGDYSFMLPLEDFGLRVYRYRRPQDALRADLERVADDYWNGIRALNVELAHG